MPTNLKKYLTKQNVVTAAEAVALVADAALAANTFVKPADSYLTAWVFASLAAVIIFMAGEFAGGAIAKGNRGLAGVSLAIGMAAIIGVGAVRCVYGFSTGSSNEGGVAGALAAGGGTDASPILMAIVVAVFMTGVLFLGLKASWDRAVAKSLENEAQIESLENHLYDLDNEMSLLEDARDAEAGRLRAKIHLICTYAFTEALEKAKEPEDGDAIVDEAFGAPSRA